MAGYTKPMEEMLNDNPGLKSRLPNVYHFDDYSVDELMQIAELYLDNNEYEITEDALISMRRTVEIAHKMRDSRFGNGRYIISLLENEIIQNLASRMIENKIFEKTDSINVIEKTDIPELTEMFVMEDILNYFHERN